MNFYKIVDEDSNKTKNYNLDIVQCFLIDDNLKTVDFFYGANEFVKMPLTNELIKKLKEIGVLKNDEKEVKKVSLVCDRCGKQFFYNVLFDKNGVSVNTISNPLLCSNCIVEVGNERKL